MGTKERRQRERQELRQDILTAARHIAAHEGWQAVTIRKVADRIEYSPPTIYEYFENKEAILIELMREGAELMLNELATARKTSLNVETAILQMALAYWNFAWIYPELYQVMHSLGGVPFCNGDNVPPEVTALTDVVVDVFRDLEQANGITINAIYDAVDITWAMLHGIVSLTMTDAIEGGRERGVSLIKRAVRDYLTALRAGAD